ncbi:cytochrome c biogenesis heme-transporting ATPase CcmA [Pleionea mediterranea]|uniref:Heme exporter protein A n=1 Tax=Pleionea mediterranea TaxID=523701 RepID=A0A316FNY3_9GAMM|nr:cytochrome c biogenesis heme-transporting ATPase CcmA [Pleionea mediterranea]PWK49973.1 heme exporter protein A [Pleionea mediterranea]
MFSEFSLDGKNLALIRGERLLFKGCCFSVSNGQVLQIQGPNGAGKTSLLRVICGLLESDSGELVWSLEKKIADFASFYQKLIYLGHQLGIKPQLTVSENIAFYYALRDASDNNTPKQQSNSLFQQAIQRVGLSGYEDELAAHLSQGQKRRVSLARLMTEKASIWILDEPFVALDTQGQAWLSRLIEQHTENGGAVIFTSHQPVALTTPVKTLQIEAVEHD